MNLNEAQSMAQEQINIWLEDTEWAFAWNRRKRAYGVCNHAKKEIQLSKLMTAHEDVAHVLDTILHEIAHALTPSHGHNAIWAAKCVEVGANPARTSETSAKDGIGVPPKWVMMFAGEIVKKYHRKPNTSTFAKLPNTWLRGKKEATYGKLEIVTYEEYKRV